MSTALTKNSGQPEPLSGSQESGIGTATSPATTSEGSQDLFSGQRRSNCAAQDWSVPAISHELYELVRGMIGPIFGIGELTRDARANGRPHPSWVGAWRFRSRRSLFQLRRGTLVRHQRHVWQGPPRGRGMLGLRRGHSVAAARLRTMRLDLSKRGDRGGGTRRRIARRRAATPH